MYLLVFKILRQHHQIAGTSFKLLTTKSDRKLSDGQANNLGYGKNVKRLDNPQPSPKGFKTYGCSSQTKCWWGFLYIRTLRYSRFPCENKALRKNYNIISLVYYYRESLKGHFFKKRNVVLKLWCPSMFWAARVLQCYRQRVFCKPNPKG